MRLNVLAARPGVRILLGALPVLITWACVCTARAESALEVSWHRPWGDARAAESLSPACGDSAREDTLFLSFKLEHPRPALSAIRGVILFSASPGDSLGTFWQFKTGWPNTGGLYMEFAPLVGSADLATPWTAAGIMELDYDHRSGRGRLDFHYAAPLLLNNNGLDPGRRYVLARIRILHRRVGLTGCAQPVCVEWAGARLFYATGREDQIAGGRERFVSWFGDRACRPLRRAPAWLPRSR